MINNLLISYDDQKSGFLVGLLLGEKSYLTNEINESFNNSSLSHVLAISGMHVTYVVLGISFIIDKVIIGKKKKNIIKVSFLAFFALFTGGTPSCIRACIMTGMVLLSENLYRKNDFLTSLLVALNIILIINPYNIENIRNVAFVFRDNRISQNTI